MSPPRASCRHHRTPSSCYIGSAAILPANTRYNGICRPPAVTSSVALPLVAARHQYRRSRTVTAVVAAAAAARYFTPMNKQFSRVFAAQAYVVRHSSFCLFCRLFTRPRIVASTRRHSTNTLPPPPRRLSFVLLLVVRPYTQHHEDEFILYVSVCVCVVSVFVYECIGSE